MVKEEEKQIEHFHFVCSWVGQYSVCLFNLVFYPFSCKTSRTFPWFLQRWDRWWELRACQPSLFERFWRKVLHRRSPQDSDGKREDIPVPLAETAESSSTRWSTWRREVVSRSCLLRTTFIENRALPHVIKIKTPWINCLLRRRELGKLEYSILFFWWSWIHFWVCFSLLNQNCSFQQ